MQGLIFSASDEINYVAYVFEDALQVSIVFFLWRKMSPILKSSWIEGGDMGIGRVVVI